LFCFSEVWGPLIGNVSELPDTGSHFLSFLPFWSNSDKGDNIVVRELMTELSRIRREVFEEDQWFNSFSRHREIHKDIETAQAISNDDSVNQLMQKRLLYLFVKDLSDGVSADVLSSKTQRDAMTMSMSLTRVSQRSQNLGWILVFLMNLGMLLYVSLFAMRQTQSRQQAWFISFVMWLVFEIFVSSTGLVFFVHLMIPMFVFTKMEKIKAKVLQDLVIFRNQYLRRKKWEKQHSRRSQDGKIFQPDEVFNAAKYLYTSWRVASLFREIPESQLILQFRTPWPKMRFGGEETQLSSEYDQAVILTAASRVLLFFVTSLLHFHEVIQDILLQTVCNSGFGYVVLLLIRLSRIHPLLSVLPVLVVLFGLFMMFRAAGRSGHLMKKKLGNVFLLMTRLRR
jgi:hypothetical protein